MSRKNQATADVARPGSTDLRARTLADLPLTEHRMDVAGIPTAVLEGGQGPPVVLLHGPGEFAALFGRVIPALATTHRVIAPDLPGHGASGVPDAGKLDGQRVLAWLTELVERTCAQPPAIVGHLLGGAMALRYAALGPSRVDRLVLVDTFGLSWNRPAPSFGVPLMAFMVRPTERSRDRFLGKCMYDFDAMRADLGPRWDPYAAYALDRARAPGSKTAVRSLMTQFGLRPVPSAEVERISAPVALVWGRHDLQTPLRVAERASARYGWPLHVVDDARDDPLFERPEASLKILHELLDDPAKQEGRSS